MATFRENLIDLCLVLGVRREPTVAEIEQAYLLRARGHHLDELGITSPEDVGKQVFLIDHAYAVLLSKAQQKKREPEEAAGPGCPQPGGKTAASGYDDAPGPAAQLTTTTTTTTATTTTAGLPQRSATATVTKHGANPGHQRPGPGDIVVGAGKDTAPAASEGTTERKPDSGWKKRRAGETPTASTEDSPEKSSTLDENGRRDAAGAGDPGGSLPLRPASRPRRGRDTADEADCPDGAAGDTQV